ncbi:MAG TPA: RHS repeat-associated core domain-containing protein [Anaerolineales bacterium]|nr:RHS repeat-associated core domain-containing protein [Anaerolineales bacterium]
MRLHPVNNDYYHYTYDAVGNRETQQKSVLGFVTNDTYVYDDANRLTSVNGVTYAWDNNGNLKKDSVNAYEYDFANRLVKTCQDTSSNGICDTGETVLASYVYNGLNDRLQETVSGVTTTFTMDLNTGLTQALSDGTHTYVYGVGRIAQATATGTEYFLGDALGSVRQMTNTSGAITYARAYDPYGVVTSTDGSSQSSYAYTGEYASQGLVYLRARYYASGMGRFLTRDTWGGNMSSPMSYNKWNYVGSNPINRTDPTGQCWYPDASRGGISYDVTDPSPALCSWFINLYQSNGITIPANATPGNWLNSIPPEHRALILSFTTCAFKNDTFLTAAQDFWMFIRFSTSPKWEYYQSRSTGAEFKLVLGIGGGGSLLCDTESQGCSLSGSLDLGENITILNYQLALSVGVEGSWDFSEGTLDLGGTADVGNCTLYASLFRISVSCGNFLDPYSYEMGFKRDKFETYLVLVNWNKIAPFGYEEFARSKLPFKHTDSSIYYQILDTDQSYDALVYRHLFEPKIIFR